MTPSDIRGVCGAAFSEALHVSPITYVRLEERLRDQAAGSSNARMAFALAETLIPFSSFGHAGTHRLLDRLRVLGEDKGV
ncbi:MAG: hypothetical protein HZB91_07685 [Elusimicrobia bacterium]|nr:hypothetical protein [Elusimicrobiota bacterium]